MFFGFIGREIDMLTFACSAFSFVGIVCAGVGTLVICVLCIMIGRGLAP